MTASFGWIAMGLLVVLVGSLAQLVINRRQPVGLAWALISLGVMLMFVGAADLASWWSN